MKVSLQYAASHFSDLANAADNGEQIEIERPDKPTLKLVISTPIMPTKRTGRRILGSGRGELRLPTDEEWSAMDKEIEREMRDAPLTTTGEI